VLHPAPLLWSIFPLKLAGLVVVVAVSDPTSTSDLGDPTRNEPMLCRPENVPSTKPPAGALAGQTLRR